MSTSPHRARTPESFLYTLAGPSDSGKPSPVGIGVLELTRSFVPSIMGRTAWLTSLNLYRVYLTCFRKVMSFGSIRAPAILSKNKLRDAKRVLPVQHVSHKTIPVLQVRLVCYHPLLQSSLLPFISIQRRRNA